MACKFVHIWNSSDDPSRVKSQYSEISDKNLYEFREKICQIENKLNIGKLKKYWKTIWYIQPYIYYNKIKSFQKYKENEQLTINNWYTLINE